MSSNVSHSVRDRLLARTRETGEDHQVILTRFALERLLYRITRLPEGEDFVLKGAFTFLIWEGTLSRQTRDLDLLGRGAPDTSRLRNILEKACKIDASKIDTSGDHVPDDGVRFDADSLQVAPIREGAEYEGLRAKLYAYIGSARLRLQIDVGFGDEITPPPEKQVFPGLLDFPEPEVKTYPPETTVAEKAHGLVRFGRANTRMKDFYDLWRISELFEIDGSTLTEAIRATFTRRETPLPSEVPIALTDRFARDSAKQRQWQAFAGQIGKVQKGEEIQSGEGEEAPSAVPSLGETVSSIQEFLVPVLRAAKGDTGKDDASAPGTWEPGGPWSTR